MSQSGQIVSRDYMASEQLQPLVGEIGWSHDSEEIAKLLEEE